MSSKKLTNRDAALSGLSVKAFTYGRTRADMVAYLQGFIVVNDKGQEVLEKEARARVMVGLVAERMGAAECNDKALEAAAALIKKPGNDTGKAGRRTIKEEKMYGAARVALSALLKKAGKKKTASMARSPAPKAEDKPEAKAQTIVAATPAFTRNQTADASTFVLAFLRTMVDKNGKALVGDLGSDVRALLAKHSPK